MKITCAHCGKKAEKPAGHVNRSRSQGLRLFCGRRCSGLGRRGPSKPKAQKKFEKRLYDIEYRRKNRRMLKAKKRAYFQRTYDPTKARVERKKRAGWHVEYCRRPEYVSWKRGYDHRYRAKKNYGPFAEAWMVVEDIRRTVKTRSTDYEIRRQNGTFGKAQARRREAPDGTGRDRHKAAESIGIA